MFEACIFDLDGTLLNTLSDLVVLTNTVLEENGMPPHTAEEVNSYVGNGARMLIQRAAVPGTSEEKIDALLVRWKELYPEIGHKLTKPYPGIEQSLSTLKAHGVKLGVLSNKFDAATQQVIGQHFPGVFDAVRGEGPQTPRKPDPTGLLSMLADFGVEPQRCAYVGDSGSDMTVALRAGAVPVGVSWGYRSVEDLRNSGAQMLLDDPIQLGLLATGGDSSSNM